MKNKSNMKRVCFGMNEEMRKLLLEARKKSRKYTQSGLLENNYDYFDTLNVPDVINRMRERFTKPTRLQRTSAWINNETRLALWSTGLRNNQEISEVYQACLFVALEKLCLI